MILHLLCGLNPLIHFSTVIMVQWQYICPESNGGNKASTIYVSFFHLCLGQHFDLCPNLLCVPSAIFESRKIIISMIRDDPILRKSILSLLQTQFSLLNLLFEV